MLYRPVGGQEVTAAERREGPPKEPLCFVRFLGAVTSDVANQFGDDMQARFDLGGQHDHKYAL